MTHPLGEPIIIFEDDFDEQYMVVPKQPFRRPSSVLTAIAVIGGGLLLLMVVVAVMSRVLRKLS